ncbi:MAG: N-acetylmuramoyl-L-alanine amidase [Clostridiales bacterium]|nr:N-acetylmuramoyl-L-alanine amidase [Clostridiales bacterium]
MYRKSLLFIAVLIALLSTVSFAEYLESEVISALDTRIGESKEFMIVNLIINGEDIIPDVPGILYNLEGSTRTLLPVRVISELMGADVQWNQETKEVEITYEDKVILLKVNSPIAYVNGVKKTLPDSVPPIIIDYLGTSRTLVPARFISEEFGMDVNWLQETRTVTINQKKQVISGVYFTMENRFPEIRVKTSGIVESSDFYIEKDNENDQLVVDIINTELSSYFKNDFIPINLLYYDSIEVSSYTKGTQNTRLTISLTDTRGYNIFYDEKSKELVIKFINSVDYLYTDEIYGVDAVVINTQESPAYNVKFYNNKIIIDVMNSLFNYNGGVYGSEESSSNLISSIAYSQFDPTKEYGPDEVVSRVVINLENETSLDEVYVEDVGNQIFVYISGDPLNGFDYYKTAQDSSQLSLNFHQGTDVKIKELSSKSIQLAFDKSSIDIDELELDIDDSIVQSFDINKSNSEYIVDIQLAENTEFEILGNGSNSFFINFFNIDLSNSKYKDMLIVLDPGHGGKDPGAIGKITGVYEKVLALKTSLILKKELEKEGFKVYMTRSTDEYISLYERANLANELGADLFVSVHINATTNINVSGVEVLYSPYTTMHSDVLATDIKNYLVRDLGAIDRGIVQRPNLIVIRETKMPAALVELGFLSNAKEEALLLKESYLEKAALAVKKGIIEFLE